MSREAARYGTAIVRAICQPWRAAGPRHAGTRRVSKPRCGIGEIRLPETQPGSSIMPGKVNPVIAESVLMAAAQVIGNDLVVTLAGQSGVFELNVMMPVMAHNVLESIRLLTASSINFADRCVAGIQADEARCAEMVEKSLAMCTALAPETRRS